MRYLYLTMFLFLAGCAESNVRPSYSLVQAQSQGHGLLVGSLSVGKYDSAYPADINYFIQPVGTPEGPHLYIPHLNVISGCDTLNVGDSDFKDVCARLFVVDLPAGDYDITGWNIDNGLKTYITPRQWVPARFTIQAGKATYIGNIHMGIAVGQNVFTIHIIAGGWAFLHDERARDIPVLKQRYPTLDDGNITIGLVILPAGDDVLKALDVPAPPPPPPLPRHRP